MTHARHLIQGASFDPVTLPILAAIFKEVWSSIAALYGEDPQTMEKARLKLATVVLDLARDGHLRPAADHSHSWSAHARGARPATSTSTSLLGRRFDGTRAHHIDANAPRGILERGALR